MSFTDMWSVYAYRCIDCALTYCSICMSAFFMRFFFFQAEDGIRDDLVTGVQTCALPIYTTPRYELERPLPCQLGGRFVIARRRVVVEAVLRAFVDELGVCLAVRLQRRLVGRNARVHALIVAGVVEHQRRLDLGRVFGARLPSVERRACAEIRYPNGELIDDAAAETEADGADASGALRMRLQPAGGGDEVFEHLRAVHLSEFHRALFVVSGKAAD